MKKLIYSVVCAFFLLTMPRTSHAAFFGTDSFSPSSLWHRFFSVAEKEQPKQIAYASDGFIIEQNENATCRKVAVLPPFIRSRVDALIMDKVGKTFFDDHISFVCGSSVGGNYSLIYMVNASVDPLVKKTITVVVNKRAKIQGEMPVPDCNALGYDCVIEITPQDALSQALLVGLKKDKGIVSIRLSDVSEYDKGFAWIVSGMFSSSQGSRSTSVLIDARTGEVATSTSSD